MEAPVPPTRIFRFGVFELDAQSGELRRQGLKIRLPHQAFQILRMLLDRPGEVVTRDELRERLWAADTFVDFDAGLNNGIRKLRDALDDSAENPRFVETLARRGYRFIAPVQQMKPDQTPPSAISATVSRIRHTRIAGLLVLALAIAAPVMLYQREWRDASRIDRASSAAGRANGSRTVNPEAYDAYLKGAHVAGRQTYEGYRSAVAYFEDAVARDPEFAEGHSALAQAQLQLLFVGPLSPREVIPKAEAAARTALRLDETLVQAHSTLGTILYNFHWRWEEGDKEFRRARELAADKGFHGATPPDASLRRCAALSRTAAQSLCCFSGSSSEPPDRPCRNITSWA